MTPVEYEVASNKVADIQSALEKLISTNYLLASSAHEAFKGIVRSYNSSKLTCFNVNELDLSALAKTCGLTVIPKVDLGVEPSKKFDAKRMKRRALGAAAASSYFQTKKRKIYQKIK